MAISQDEFNKAMGQFRLQLNAIMNVFNVYGLTIYVDSAKMEISLLAEQLAKRIQGEDIPIKVVDNYKRRITE